ncbi:MAG: hypothetical protein LBP40_05660 [Campylobacteraceae bacterium]|nr:hypothetical protein [Campylobacteraceae bacterium]
MFLSIHPAALQAAVLSLFLMSFNNKIAMLVAAVLIYSLPLISVAIHVLFLY